MKLNPKFVTCIPRAIAMANGKFRHKYVIDYTNPELRNLKNWEVVDTVCAHPCNSGCKKDFFKFVRNDFREEQGRRSIATHEVQVESTMKDWELPLTYGNQLAGRIINKDNEKKSSQQKLRKRFPCKVDEVPENVKFILRSDFDAPNCEPTQEKFLQKETENSKIFFLQEELHLLESFSWFIDGTFSIVRNSKFSQIYIISVLFEANSKVFAYPVLFAFMEKKNYRFV